MATMKDVAELAGVSTATVSRTLMNPEKVSPNTRKRVEEAIIKSGYIPSLASRASKRNESKAIVVVVPDICDMYFSEVIRGIEDTALEHGYAVVLGDAAKYKQYENRFVDLLFTKQADGMILLGGNMPFGLSLADQRSLPPIVMSCEHVPEFELPTVHIDNVTAAYDVINYLIQMGHRRIGQISGPKNSQANCFRTEGYQQALRRSCRVVDESLTLYGDNTIQSGEQLAKQLMRSSSPPTAIFCHNDMMAIGAMLGIKSLGLEVPRHVSIIGFGDIEYSAYTEPPLTTVCQPRYNIGRESMLMLLERLRGSDRSIPSKTMETQIMIRGSVCFPYDGR